MKLFKILELYIKGNISLLFTQITKIESYIQTPFAMPPLNLFEYNAMSYLLLRTSFGIMISYACIYIISVDYLYS